MGADRITLPQFPSPSPKSRKEMSSILADEYIAPSYMSTNAGGGGVAGSQPISTAVHMETK
jgi:hypothetical protein